MLSREIRKEASVLRCRSPAFTSKELVSQSGESVSPSIVTVVFLYMEETLKILSIAPKILARTSNAVWDILLSTKQEAKQLAGSILTAKSMRLQMEYMSTQRTRIIVHGVPIDICEECIGAGGFFSSYGQVEEVTFITSKSEITTGNIKAFGNIPNILMCWKK